jgi:branched-chain amino acid transport system permease protein
MSIAALAVIRSKIRLGLAMRAVSDDENLSRSIGVNVEQAILASVLCGSALAGLAGVLWGYNTAINPQMGFAALLSGIVAALIGGVGSLRGVLFGSILLATLQQVVIWTLPSHWQDVPVFIVLIIFLLFKPYDVLGKRHQKVRV